MAAISYPGSRSFSLGVVRSVNKSVRSGALNRGRKYNGVTFWYMGVTDEVSQIDGYTRETANIYS